MNSEHIMYSVIVGALSWASVVAWKAYLKRKSEENEIESRVKMSAEETEKLRIFEKATRYRLT